jgi:hypothetical protein
MLAKYCSCKVGYAFCLSESFSLSDRQVQLRNGVLQDCNFIVPSLKFRIDKFKDRRTFTVTKLAQDDIVLGKPWLTQFNPDIV